MLRFGKTYFYIGATLGILDGGVGPGAGGGEGFAPRNPHTTLWIMDILAVIVFSAVGGKKKRK